jgi:hypothetical protein
LLCLVFNPFVFDFFVVARGYSLALAALAWAIAIPAGILREPTKLAEPRLLWVCAASSACAALSFSANFSSAFADAGILLTIFLWIRAEAPRINPPPSLAGSILVCWPRWRFRGWWWRPDLRPRRSPIPREPIIFWGEVAGRKLRSMVGPSLYQLNPHLFRSRLYALLAPPRHLLLPLLSAAVAFQFDLDLAEPVRLAVGAISAVSVASNAGRGGHKMLVGMLSVMAVYFLLCLRLDHFREWRYDSEAHQAYLVVDQYNRRCARRDRDERAAAAARSALFDALSNNSGTEHGAGGLFTG